MDLAKAINDAAEYEVIRIPPGTFTITQALVDTVCKKHLTLSGAGVPFTKLRADEDIIWDREKPLNKELSDIALKYYHGSV